MFEEDPNEQNQAAWRVLRVLTFGDLKSAV
jgi:hypothetical protein